MGHYASEVDGNYREAKCHRGCGATGTVSNLSRWVHPEESDCFNFRLKRLEKQVEELRERLRERRDG